MNHIQFLPGAIDPAGCVRNAWNLLKQNYGMYLGIALIALILTGCIPCLNVFLMGPVMGGVAYVVLRDMRGEPVDFGMMFKGFEKFVPLMVIGVIQAVPGIIVQIIQFTVDLGRLGLGGAKGGQSQFFQSSERDVALAGGMLVVAAVAGLAFAIFAVIWWAVLFFAIPLAMEHDLGPIEAIKLSVRAATSNLGGLVVLMIFQILIALLGIVMFCLGVFLFSIPIIYIANAFAYRQVFPWIEQNFNMSPRPPNAYGSSFGSGI